MTDEKLDPATHWLARRRIRRAGPPPGPWLTQTFGVSKSNTTEAEWFVLCARFLDFVTQDLGWEVEEV